MTTFKDAMRTSAGSSNATVNEQHTCAQCNNVDLSVGPGKPFCRICWRSIKAEKEAQANG